MAVEVMETKVAAMITPQLVMIPPVDTIARLSPRIGPCLACSSKTRVVKYTL